MISSDSLLALGGSLGSLLFASGGFFYMVRGMRKDINGIGRKANEERILAARRHHNTSLAVMALAPPEHRHEIAALLKEEV